MQILRDRKAAGVYEPSQASYRSPWFCVAKKEPGKVRLVHDLQPLNAVTIRSAGLPPKLDEFVEPFAGSSCYTVLDLYSGYDGRKLDPKSRDLTTFSSPLGLLRLTCMPQGFTNSVTEFQDCMTFILQDEIPHIANIFIDDCAIKGPVKHSIWIRMEIQRLFLKIQELESLFGNMHRIFTVFYIALAVQVQHFQERKCKYANQMSLYLAKSVLRKVENLRMQR